ncbi:MAG TPA: hypothetical protein VGP55_12965 [Chitinophagaceae bacterium]|nr:hypothetical protein [Chitinophagaceae bacterium]
MLTNTNNTNNTATSNKSNELQITTDDLPCIFILIPFESGFNKKSHFDTILNTAVGKAEKKLMQNYPANQLEPVAKKLHRVIQKMAYKSNNKSIAIMVSPLVEKVYYFN